MNLTREQKAVLAEALDNYLNGNGMEVFDPDESVLEECYKVLTEG